jgi:hypothetical protein
MSVLSELIKAVRAALKAKVPVYLMQIAMSAVEMVEVLSNVEGYKGESKRAKAKELIIMRLKAMRKEIGKDVKESAINAALEMAVLALPDEKQADATADGQ